MNRILLLAVIGLCVAGYVYRDTTMPVVNEVVARIRPNTEREREVRAVFANFEELLTHGDLRSENVYLPTAVFRMSWTDKQGQRAERTMTAAQHRDSSIQVLPRIRSGQVKIRFQNVRFAEQSDGKVRVDLSAFLNDDVEEEAAMVFVNTAPKVWAIAEEIHRGK